MHVKTLVKVVRKVWPDYKWSPVDVGRERSYVTEVTPYSMQVEWSGGATLITISREYGSSGNKVSVVGASDGNTAEAARRAYFDAKASWISLNRLHLDPRQSDSTDSTDDNEFFERFSRLD
jgi:hypothetical protein